MTSHTIALRRRAGLRLRALLDQIDRDAKVLSEVLWDFGDNDQLGLSESEVNAVQLDSANLEGSLLSADRFARWLLEGEHCR